MAIHKRWLTGVHKIMVCTSAFSSGNDYPHTRVVIHAGTPVEMVGFIQEIGRAGRDKDTSECYVIPKGSRVMKLAPGQQDHKGIAAARDYCSDYRSCLRFKITSFCDGVQQGVRCTQVLGCQYCDFCTREHGQPDMDLDTTVVIPPTTM